MARPISFCLLALAFLVFMNASATSSSRTTRRPHQDPSYLKFVSNATDFQAEESYDYIVVGGTAGFPLAATLSSRFRVLLMDAISFDSPAQAFTSEDGVPNVRGRTLGGSSAINVGSCSPADQEFYKRSSFNWDLKVVNESYEWVERAIVFRPELRKWQSAIPEGLLEAGVGPYNGYTLDNVVGSKTGGSTFDTLGRRHSAADLPKYAKPSNIRVAVHATVEKVLLAPSTASLVPRQSAIGIVFGDQNGSTYRAMLQEHGEVLLSAGHIKGCGHLFLLSGIDPRPHLGSLGIHHITDVGNLCFGHPDCSTSKTCVSSGSPSRVSRAVFAAAGMWFLWLVHKLCVQNIIDLPGGGGVFRGFTRQNPPDPADNRRIDPNFRRSVTVTRTDRPFTRSMARWIVPYLPPLALGNNQQERGADFRAFNGQNPPEPADNRDPDFSCSVTVTRADQPFTRSMARWIVPYLPPLALGNNQQERGADGWAVVPYQGVQQHVSQAIVRLQALPLVNECRDIIVYQPPLGEPLVQPPLGEPPVQPPLGEAPLQPTLGDPGSRLLMVALLSMVAVFLFCVLHVVSSPAKC